MKTLKQLLKIYSNHIEETNVLTAVKEWLTQKRQELVYPELGGGKLIDQLLEELNNES